MKRKPRAHNPTSPRSNPRRPRPERPREISPLQVPPCGLPVVVDCLSPRVHGSFAMPARRQGRDEYSACTEWYERSAADASSPPAAGEDSEDGYQ